MCSVTNEMGTDEHLFHAFVGQPLDRPGKRRLQPLRGAHAALIAQQMRPGPDRVLLCTQLTSQTHRLLNLFRIRIALSTRLIGRPCALKTR